MIFAKSLEWDEVKVQVTELFTEVCRPGAQASGTTNPAPAVN